MTIFRLIVLSAFLLIAATGADAAKRVALVIGNAAYRNVPELANPRNDAADMAAKLEGLGFDVVLGVDLDHNGLRATIRQFAARLDGAELALFFYAGHGLQVNGQNYIAPVDAKLASAIDLDFETVPMDLVLSAMERATQTNLIFLDACRNNPLADNLARSMGTRSAAVGRGLAKIGSGVGSLIAFSTQPGNVALDGKGRNSPFTTALLKHLGTPGQSITEDLTSVRRDVLASTDGKQVPWDNSSLTGPVVLNERPEESEPDAKAGPASPAVPAMPSNLAEITYWDSIRDSSDRVFFDAYLKRYPDGNYADLAKLKIAALEEDVALRNSRGSEKRSKNVDARHTVPPGLPGGGDATRAANPDLARRFKVADLGVDADPRLIKALNVLGRYEIRYGVFRERLYIAVLGWGTTWREAYDLSARAGGHLVTIADKLENEFVFNLFSKDDRFVDVGEGGKDLNGPWIGLYQQEGSKEPKGGWRWVTGEPLRYSNWNRHQPNNYDGSSDVGLFYSYGARNPRDEQRPIRWDDANGAHGKRGFIVEIEAAESG